MKKLLALLLLRANQVVGLDSLVEELWGDSPPQTAITTTQTYVYHLRKLVTEATVRTAAPGYVLETDEDSVDANRFDSLMAKAQASASAGDHRATVGQAKEALALWRGTPLAGVDCGNVLRGYAVNLEERHLAALELRVRAEMQLGNYREMIADLRSLVAVHSLNEWFHAQLITALHRVGRRSEALRAYQTVRELLRRELGLEPSHELWQLHQEILASDMRTRVPRGRMPMVAGGLIRPASAL